MSELQAILARRRLLNRESSNDEKEASSPPPPSSAPAIDDASIQPPPDKPDEPDELLQEPSSQQPPQMSPPKKSTPLPQTPPRIAGDLQAKLRERRRMAHGGDDGDRETTHAAVNDASSISNRPPRKSTFFPRSTPIVPNSFGGISKPQEPTSSPASTRDTNVYADVPKLETPDSMNENIGAGKSVEGTTTSLNIPSSPYHNNARRSQTKEEPKSPSMLDLMEERYKQQKLLRQQQQQQQQLTDPPMEPRQNSGSNPQQQSQIMQKDATYYRSGMRPPSSSFKSYPLSPGSVSNASSTGNHPTLLPPSPRTTNSTNNFKRESSSSNHSQSDAPSESSVVDGSVFSETENIPEFMRMKLKKTNRDGTAAADTIEMMQEETLIAKQNDEKGAQRSAETTKTADPPTRRWRPKVVVEKEPPVMKRWQPPQEHVSKNEMEKNAIQMGGPSWQRPMAHDGTNDIAKERVVKQENELGVPSFDSAPEDSTSLDSTHEDVIIDERPNPNTMPMFNNYDTAVLAAKVAIDASNRSRSRPTTTTEELDVADPDLIMEPSPESSLDGLEHEDRGASLESEEADINNETLKQNGFGTSFVDSSIDMFANSDDEKENKEVMSADDFGFAPTPFFGSDPFDALFDGEKSKSRGGVEEDVEPMDTLQENVLRVTSSEESHRFDAQFEDSFGGMATTTDENIAEPQNEMEDSYADNGITEDISDGEIQEEDETQLESESAAAVDVDEADVAEESAPQSREAPAGGVISESLSVDSQYDDEAAALIQESPDILEKENEIQQFMGEEEDIESTTGEVIFDDNFGTFTKQTLDIPFGDLSQLHRIPSPTQNPLTDNLIICRYEDGDFFIHEVDTASIHSPTTLMSVRVVSNSLKAKLSRSLGASRQIKVMGISSVLSLAAGVHRVHGRERVRVAALIELVVTSSFAPMKRVRVVAVWKWGYNSGKGEAVSLQSVLGMAGIDDDSITYEPKTLQVADGLLFIGGQKATTPTVFVAKPAVRDGWVSISISDTTKQRNTNGLSVSTIAAINDENTFLAVGLTDGSLSVWTYDLAVRTNRIAQHTDGQHSSLLQPVCQMQGEIDVANLSDHDCLWKSDDRPSHSDELDKSGSNSMSLSWIQPCSSGISSLPLLAVTFSSGVAVYHVYSSRSQEGKYEESILSANIIQPLAKAKYSASPILVRQTKVSWFDLGPRSPPCLSIILNEGSTAKLNLCAIDIPWYGSSEIVDPAPTYIYRSIGVLSQIECEFIGDSVDMFTISHLGAIGCYSGGMTSLFQPSLHGDQSIPNVADGYLSSLCRPVSSESLGINTDGSIWMPGEGSTSVKSEYEDAVLSVFSLNTCSKVHDLESPNTKWGFPSQRNWLLISAPGDKPLGSLLREEADDGNFNISYRREAERACAVSDVLCELTCGENPVAGLVPERIVREDGGRRAAVLFTSSFFGSNISSDASGRRRRTHTRIPTDPVAYALLDIDEAMLHRSSTSFTLRHARDVSFLPTFIMEGGFYCSSIVVLDPDGTGLSITTVISSRSRGGTSEKVIESEDKCSLHHEGIEGRRVFTLLNDGHPQLLLAGHSTVVGRPCLIITQHELERDTYSNTYALIESESLGHRLWLAAGEEVVSIRELPKHPNAIRALIAVATQCRVMIVSVNETSLSIIAEVKAYLTCPSLSPLGSHCVAFSTSSTPYCDDESCIMYLSCLQGAHGYGVIASLPGKRNRATRVLLKAIRPDRVIISMSHGGVKLFGKDEQDNKFDIPLSITRPVLLLEPLIANALCQDLSFGENAVNNAMVQQSLDLVIEKFGRKETSLPHGDNEGIGCVGAGMTSKAYHVLAQYQCYRAASLLLAGNKGGNADIKTKIMPPWATIPSKLMATIDCDVRLQILSNNDTGVGNIVRSSHAAEALAYSFASDESNVDAFRILDNARTKRSEDILRQMVISRNAQDVMLELNYRKEGSVVRNDSELITGLISSFVNRTKKGVTNVQASQFAPSVQPNTYANSPVHSSILNRESLQAAIRVPPEQKSGSSSVFESAHSRHIWSTGPFGKKEKLLTLDSLEDWLGRCRPAVLGSEGVSMAADTGEQTLKDILLAASQEEVATATAPEQDHCDQVERKQNWVEGIGNAHLDDDNLSLYLRFSEGADEDNALDVFSDLSKHGHKCQLYGSEFATVEATTSSADEGEEGKVHLLHDIVFNQGAPRDVPTGIVAEVKRGDSLDVGMLHSMQNKPRQKCTIEFWYHLPQSNLFHDEIILARRSILFEDTEDPSCLCLPDAKYNILWELALLPTGLLELRTGAGSVVSSAMAVELHGENASKGIVSWEREDGGGGWNHVCVQFSAKPASSPTEFLASILMNGDLVVSSAEMFVNPLEAELPRFINDEDLEDAMEKSILVFGIGPSVGFRITEIRVWACLRDYEDVKLMMYEHLRDAEMKKKLKVNIRKVAKKTSGMLAPPISVTQTDNRRINPISPPSQPNKESFDEFLPDFANFEANIAEKNADTTAKSIEYEETKESSPSYLVKGEENTGMSLKTDPPADPSYAIALSDLLSSKVRKSASSAIVRGPPAARHFGGNRGGLLGQGKHGVGPIAICGSDKAIVFYHDLDPPAKTYPIGASGAILSDIMNGTSEYMCCFLAKEKRMIVFELALKAVVVELQMKTKLNFWRYLPPEADGGALTFMLITPIGGFHWKPLDDSPRPCQVWSRGPELESKKILTYEEGGSSGRHQPIKSTLALILASQGTSDTAVEVHCILLENESSRLCISDNVLGAALYCHPNQSCETHFLPYVVYVSQDEDAHINMIVQELHVSNEPDDKKLSLGKIKGSVILDLDDSSYVAPQLSMGTSPEALCCCHDGFIVVTTRNGVVFAYNFSSGVLSFIGRIELGQYVVDAAIRSGNSNHEVELVVLLCEREDTKDGRIANITFSRD